ncbi:MAG: glycine zipper 2TM domain-containing protein [Halarcobacter sp.]
MKNIFLITILSISSLFAGSDRFIDFAKVTYSEPIYEYVNSRSHRQECKEVRYKVKNDNYYDNYDDRYYSSNYNDGLGVDTLIGTAAGAIIGSQIGKGNGRVAAQIVGGLLGAKVAHEVRNNYKPEHNYNRNNRAEYRYETRTECYDKPKRHKRKMITAYKNYFNYKGVEHYKVTNRPLRKVKITHRIDF